MDFNIVSYRFESCPDYKNQNNMAQQTAVKWFIDEIESKGEAWENASIRKIQISIDVSGYLELKRQANKMFEQQIEDAFVAGDERGTKDIPFNAEQYYTQTYGK